jgi:hypothetical protein
MPRKYFALKVAHSIVDGPKRAAELNELYLV